MSVYRVVPGTMTVEDLQRLGMARMDEREMQNFLSTQNVGVLGLQAPEGPYLLPMSFGFGGDEALYFTYVLGGESQKLELTEQADSVQFLVYDATSKFTWQSLLLEGSLRRVSEKGWDDISEALRNAWHPDVFAQAHVENGVAVYELVIEDWSGFKQTGLPPGLRSDD